MSLFYLFSICITFFFEKSITYSAIGSFTGFVVSYFIADEFDGETICEYREIEVVKQKEFE